MTGHDEVVAPLRRDYERIALAGIKTTHDDRAGDVLNAEDAAALARLEDASLAVIRDGAFTLLRGEDANLPLDETTLDVMRVLYAYWRRADEESSGDEVLYGEVGFWQHWWNMLQEHPDRISQPLEIDFVVADDPEFTEREWLDDFDQEILEHVRSLGLITGRVLVPPATLGAPAESMVDWLLALGLSVRVFPSPSQYVIYDGVAAVLHDHVAEGELDRHRLTRRAAVIEPLQQLFTMQWAAAIPWEEHTKEGGGVLELLALGWIDARIADSLGVSIRTVSRRVTHIMRASGAQSRFELGMKYALSRLDDPVP